MTQTAPPKQKRWPTTRQWERDRRSWLGVLPFNWKCRMGQHWACYGERGRHKPRPPCECPCHARVEQT